METNKKNIGVGMDELEKNPIPGMWYKAFLLEDGVSFMHLNISDDEATMNRINEVELFNRFRTELKAGKPVVPPKSEQITLILPEK